MACFEKPDPLKIMRPWLHKCHPKKKTERNREDGVQVLGAVHPLLVSFWETKRKHVLSGTRIA